jgi:hypothetical protein
MGRRDDQLQLNHAPSLRQRLASIFRHYGEAVERRASSLSSRRDGLFSQNDVFKDLSRSQPPSPI